MTEESQHKLTPTEHLRDLTMALATKTAPKAAATTPTIGQYSAGARQHQWYCKDLGGNPLEAATPLKGWAQELELARQVQRDLTALNAEQLTDALEATLEKVKS
jgi:hypothetical protein